MHSAPQLEPRTPGGSLRGAGVAGIATALPAEVVTNAPIAAHLGVDERWIVARTGVLERRRAGSELTLTDLAAAAGISALERARVDAGELDLVLVATFTADRPALGGQPAGDRGADSARGAGHQRAALRAPVHTHSTTPAPKARPAPKAASSARVPGRRRPSASASASAIGMLAAEVFP